MKRIISACLEQTVRFETAEEFSAFTSAMNRKETKYKILENASQSDGSVIVKLKKQYNHYDTGSYMEN